MAEEDPYYRAVASSDSMGQENAISRLSSQEDMGCLVCTHTVNPQSLQHQVHQDTARNVMVTVDRNE